MQGTLPLLEGRLDISTRYCVILVIDILCLMGLVDVGFTHISDIIIIVVIVVSVLKMLNGPH